MMSAVYWFSLWYVQNIIFSSDHSIANDCERTWRTKEVPQWPLSSFSLGLWLNTVLNKPCTCCAYILVWSCMHAQLLHSCLILCSPVDCSLPVPLSLGTSRQEYWSRLPCPPPGDLHIPGIKPASFMCPALAGGFSTTSATWEALSWYAAAAKSSVVSDSAWPGRQKPTRLHCPWDSPGKNTGVGCHCLLHVLIQLKLNVSISSKNLN